MASRVKSKKVSKAFIGSHYIVLVYILVGLSIVAGYFGVHIGGQHLEFVSQNYQAILIMEFVVLFASFFLSHVSFINVFLLFTFTFITGLTLSPLIAVLLLTPEGSILLTQAFFMTLLMVGALSIYALTTNRNFSSAQGFMFFVLLIFVGFGLINYFLKSSFLDTLYSFLGVVIFGIYLVIDTQRLLYEKEEAPTTAAMMIYLDIFNLFIFILKTLMWFKGDKD